MLMCRQLSPSLNRMRTFKSEKKNGHWWYKITMDRAAWKLAIHVPEPWVGCEILWVSPLAYSNLFGTKGFVLVVVSYTHWYVIISTIYEQCYSLYFCSFFIVVLQPRRGRFVTSLWRRNPCSGFISGHVQWINTWEAQAASGLIPYKPYIHLKLFPFLILTMSFMMLSRDLLILWEHFVNQAELESS
jgi:hypothetical protein